jgi:hypothetical protein
MCPATATIITPKINLNLTPGTYQSDCRFHHTQHYLLSSGLLQSLLLLFPHMTVTILQQDPTRHHTSHLLLPHDWRLGVGEEAGVLLLFIGQQFSLGSVTYNILFSIILC